MRIKYNNATVYIHGKIDKQIVENATNDFMIRVQRSKKNGNNDKTGAIKEK